MEQIELIRKKHQEIEEAQDEIMTKMLHPSKKHKENLLQQTRISKLLENIQENSSHLLELYKDEDNFIKNEVHEITAKTNLSLFYKKLKDIKSHYQSSKSELVEKFNPSRGFSDEETAYLDRMFTGEESAGKYFDLHELHQQYLNLKNTEKWSYLSYIDRFERFKIINSDTRKSTSYWNYLSTMESYLYNFIIKTKPILKIEDFVNNSKDEFLTRWANHEIPDWEYPEISVDLFCIACNKQFLNPKTYENHFAGKKHKKAALKSEKDSGKDKSELAKAAADLEYEKLKPIAMLERSIMNFMSILKETREETKGHVERKQALTEKERMEDIEDPGVDLAEEEEEEEEEKIYNPLKLPIGWDGKPIPYWLFKLHGLGIEYPCEICGGYIYMGRKAFEKHFQEYRHAHGMKSLGIPNSRYFQDIHLIQDAKNLAEKLKNQAKDDQAAQDIIEEFEDEHGNIFNKKTYEDLKRQGII